MINVRKYSKKKIANANRISYDVLEFSGLEGIFWSASMTWSVKPYKSV